MEYNRNNKHQIVVHDKVIIEKIKLQGKIIEREVLVKEFKPFSKTISQNTVYFDKNINLK